MNIQFLGVGSAFGQENFQSNLILEHNGKRLLIDAGGDIRRSLKAAGLTLRDLDAVYISHLHADHAGGAEYLGYGTYFDPGFKNADGSKRRLKLFLHESIQEGLWQMMRHGAVLTDRSAVIGDFFEVGDTSSESFTWEGITFTLVRTVHCLDNGTPMPCFGLTWFNGTKQIWFSADSILDHNNDHLLESADVIFHDCETAFATGVHAHYKDLVKLPAHVKAKMHLYHYNDGAKADAVAEGFAGWVVQGKVYQL